MTELLFKLKKDGKTVGYEKCQLDNDYDAPKIYNTDGISYHYPKKCQWWYSNVYRLSWCTVREDHDEKCIFVCKDRNGKEVFEGDKVLADMTELTGEKDIQEVDVVVCGGFNFWDVEGHTFVEADNAGIIELIEDADMKGVENES